MTQSVLKLATERELLFDRFYVTQLFVTITRSSRLSSRFSKVYLKAKKSGAVVNSAAVS